ELPVGFVIAAPPVADQGAGKLNPLFLFLNVVAPIGAAAIATEQDEVAYPLRVSRRICDGLGPALRQTEQDELVEAGGIHHGAEVVHEMGKARFDILALRQ